VKIGGIYIFLPSAQEEAGFYDADAAGEQSQLRMTVKEEEELEQTLKAAQAGEENDCSKEQLNNFSRVAEQRSVVEMGLTAKAQAGAKEEDEHSEEWLSIFSMKLKTMQQGRLQKQKKKTQTTYVWLICGIKLKPWRKG
jgi:hypothetical protein